MENCWKIGTGALRAYVAKPGTVYARTRFDWTGFIPQVEMNGKTYCAPEMLPGMPDPTTDGQGLCCEFHAPVGSGYGEGGDDLFVKPGIGILRRIDDAPYGIYKTYPIVETFPCEVKVGEDCIDFHLGALPFKGYAFTQDRHISVLDNCLLSTTTVTNVGEKALQMDEYCHNFLSLNKAGSSKDVELTLQKGYWADRGAQSVVMHPEMITFDHDFAGDFMIYGDKENLQQHAKRWVMRDKKQGLRVEEWGDFPIANFLSWGRSHVLSAEIYVAFTLEKGESYTWTRMWKFVDDNAAAQAE